jgi:hypothetical protein
MHGNNGATKIPTGKSETPYNSLAYEKLKFWEIKEIQ